MVAFEVGKAYSTQSICDHNCVWTFVIIRRTGKTVSYRIDGEIVSRRVSEFNGAEGFRPFGSYSMAPIVRAA